MPPVAIATRSTTSDVQSEFVETPIARPRRSEVERAIRDEALAKGKRCNRNRANATLKMIERAAVHGRATDYHEAYVLDPDELRGLHGVLGAIMPDDRLPTEGSAHELVTRFVTAGPEYAIVHTRDGDDHCVVAIRVHAAV